MHILQRVECILQKFCVLVSFTNIIDMHILQWVEWIIQIAMILGIRFDWLSFFLSWTTGQIDTFKLEDRGIDPWAYVIQVPSANTSQPWVCRSSMLLLTFMVETIQRLMHPQENEFSLCIISISANLNWPLHPFQGKKGPFNLYKLDMKNAFLHGDCHDQVYLLTSPSFVRNGRKKGMRLEAINLQVKPIIKGIWFEKFSGAAISFGLQDVVQRSRCLLKGTRLVYWYHFDQEWQCY